MSSKTAMFAGLIIGNIVNNLSKFVDNDEPICPRLYNLKDVEDCGVGCIICWTRALEIYDKNNN